jgi:hypothetical protein
MVGKLVVFKKVQMENGKVTSATECEGRIFEKYDDAREKNGQIIINPMYVIADNEGFLHHVRIFNITRLLE